MAEAPEGACADADLKISREIDAWIIAVLRRGGVKIHVFSDRSIGLVDVPSKWARVIEALSAGVHAAARGDELPKITREDH